MEEEMSFSKIMMMIEHLNVKIQTVAKSVGKKTEEMKQKKISLNRLNSQIQKQILFNKQLNNEINNIDKPKHEYEDELNDKLHNKKRMLSKINDQFEEIQRLLAEKDDRNEFIDHQIKFSTENSNSTHKNTILLSKRLESEKKDKYYKSLCKTLMIEDILSNNLNVKIAKKLTDENIVFSEKLQNSKKALKMVLENVELWKYRYGTYFDESYDRADKTKIMKLLMSTFNLLINNGYMCYWKSMAKVLTENAQLWTTPAHDRSGIHFKVNFPFDENRNLTKNKKQTNEGFESLKY